MKILVLGPHPHRNQPSMFRFCDWIVQSLEDQAEVRRCSAPPLFLNIFTRNSRGAKWLFYVDQFFVLTVLLAWRSMFYDQVIVADHSNSISTLLVVRRKLAAMVHDMVGVRLALEGIQGAPAAGPSGRAMQRLVLAGLRRTPRLAVSAEKVSRELLAFGVTCPTVSVGCTLDMQRLGTSRRPADLAARIGGRPFILNVATDDWRKRKPFLIRTWQRLKSIAPHAPLLVLAGYTRPDSVAVAEEVGDGVVLAGELDDAELVWLYQNCSATIAASTEEGFCIPILESIYFDKPVFGVRGAAYTEIFGDAIIPFDVAAPDEAAAQIGAMLAKPEARETALSRRNELISHFSFAEFSRRLLTAFGLDGIACRTRQHHGTSGEDITFPATAALAAGVSSALGAEPSAGFTRPG